jgi:STE24 endopeptidase
LVRQAGLYWWIYGLFVFVGWQMLMIVAYPKFILPLFNKLTPLEEGELRDRLSALGERAGFPVCRIEVIDGSRRSGHSNAFFTGFGKARRIVLYDTLIRQLSTCELEAVLAHEIGHYRKGHIPRMIGLSALLAGVCFAAIAWIDRSPAILEAFGFAAGSGSAPAFFIALLLAGPVGFCLSPLLHALSRRHEYEADAYARELTGGHQSLESALLKLQTENLSNLVPHPLYSAIHYSHPALRERLAALRGGSGGTTCTPSA